MTNRIRFSHVTRQGNRGYRADIFINGEERGFVERADRPSGLGYRSGSYQAYIDGSKVSADDRLDGIRLDINDGLDSGDIAATAEEAALRERGAEVPDEREDVRALHRHLVDHQPGVWAGTTTADVLVEVDATANDLDLTWVEALHAIMENHSIGMDTCVTCGEADDGIDREDGRNDEQIVARVLRDAGLEVEVWHTGGGIWLPAVVLKRDAHTYVTRYIMVSWEGDEWAVFEYDTDSTDPALDEGLKLEGVYAPTLDGMARFVADHVALAKADINEKGGR